MYTLYKSPAAFQECLMKVAIALLVLAAAQKKFLYYPLLCPCGKCIFSFRKLFVDFRRFLILENFDKLIFRSVDTIFLKIQSSFKRIFFVHDTNLKVLRKAIHETQHLSLKVFFLVIKTENGTQITNWLLFSSFLVMVTANTWCFSFRKLFVDFLRLRVFLFTIGYI